MRELRSTDYDDDGSEEKLTRYIYSNHLQSASLELNEEAKVISYEEYHPYGTTAYQASNSAINAVAKRYRYTGKERDDESGLYYNGARYYVPWLGRWTTSDPLESKYAGMSPYNYSFNNPVMFNDPSGMDPKDGNKPLIAADATAMAPRVQMPLEVDPSAPLPDIGGFLSGKGSSENQIVLEETVIVSTVESRDGAMLYFGDKIGNEERLKAEAPGNKKIQEEAKLANYRNSGKRYQGQDLNGNYYNVSPREIAQAEYESNEAWGANIRGGLGGAVGSLWGGKEWAAIGSVFDGLLMSFASVGTPYGKVGPNRPIEKSFVPTTEFAISTSGGKANSAQYSQLKQFYSIAESANAIVESLQRTGALPPEYVTKDAAELAGWSKGKALNNYVPGGQIGGNIYKNTTRQLPNANGRRWFEADIGLTNTMGRNKQPGTRLLYSNDGLLYITPNHYETMIFLGRYK
jgi:RHS repeat-associated protein